MVIQLTWDEWRDWFERRRRRRFPFFDDWYFRSVEEVIRDMERMMDEMFRGFTEHLPKELVRERKLPNGRTIRESGPIIWGYSVTVGPDGKPVIREFGNLKPSVSSRPWEPPFSIREEREPLADVIETEDEVRVVAELPGVEKKDINLHATSNSLTIKVDTEERKYYKRLELPSEVNPKNAKSTYKNGVLEVTLEKVKKKRYDGVPINIE